MNPSYYATFIPLIFLLILIFYQNRQNTLCAHRIITNRYKKTGETEYYASNVKNFKPYAAINENKTSAYDRIKDIIVKEMNDG